MKNESKKEKKDGIKLFVFDINSWLSVRDVCTYDFERQVPRFSSRPPCYFPVPDSVTVGFNMYLEKDPSRPIDKKYEFILQHREKGFLHEEIIPPLQGMGDRFIAVFLNGTFIQVAPPCGGLVLAYGKYGKHINLRSSFQMDIPAKKLDQKGFYEVLSRCEKYGHPLEDQIKQLNN